MLSHATDSVPGSMVEFAGYYTFQLRWLGKTTGLLSVNASTGQVWMHQWHGALRHIGDLE